jgi:hypothetical protein
MKNYLVEKLMLSMTCLNQNHDDLVHEFVIKANSMEPGKRFHLRDLVDHAVWRAWYLYWKMRNISVVLQLGKKFYQHPELNARFVEYDPDPNDGAAVYVNP